MAPVCLSPRRAWDCRSRGKEESLQASLTEAEPAPRQSCRLVRVLPVVSRRRARSITMALGWVHTEHWFETQDSGFLAWNLC